MTYSDILVVYYADGVENPDKVLELLSPAEHVAWELMQMINSKVWRWSWVSLDIQNDVFKAIVEIIKRVGV